MKNVTILFVILLQLALSAGSGRNEVCIEWVSKALKAEGLEHKTFQSDIIEGEASFHIYLPKQYYQSPEKRLPVMYWLHGSGGKPSQDYRAGGGRGPAAISKHFGTAMQEGKIPPMIIVYPNGLRKGMWVDSKDGKTPVESLVIKELIPHIDKNFRTIADNSGRLIAGHSAGGYGAARLGFKYPELFCAVSMRGAGPLQEVFVPERGPEGNARTRGRVLRKIYGSDQEYFKRLSPLYLAEKNAEKIRKNLQIRQIIGEKDYCLPANIEFHRHLEALDIPHEFTILDSVKHDTHQLMQVLGESSSYWQFYRSVFGSLKTFEQAESR
ncbi:Endo-1,4-beta-xylanase Z precursor [Sedimentisphaera cyanobacteriorum]|uniref:Endo-1,4-beta-xylanase Z n=1 Tax=Sedimentisphaera cyanobacteriorum TaxID=1940790 RepID=A0A1Q2HS83_9BACT|nr:alpha/beta hydrolase-fold protein [Sedimentisphaera cyanobacteriorum]AQQ10191.1 Endo-1,4-beta-xylanase Z precursor [Sedimentisphaera cyanobacteriorum]